MKTKKEITINELAEMMQREFGVVGDKMENMQGDMESMKSEMNKRFDQVLDRLENLETDNTMDATAYRRQEDKLENHEKRISVAEKKLGIGVMG